MAINVSKLISAAMLQDEIVSKTGKPLSAGIITMYRDNSRTTLKNWYYQSGSPGNYSYITLPNPLTLSAAGTITDVNGCDTIPFYYPWSELNEDDPDPYYVTVDAPSPNNCCDQVGERQFTRQNFPFLPPGNSSSTEEIATLENYLINNRFWRNIGTYTVALATQLPQSILINGIAQYYITLAPSQHDGFNIPDFVYLNSTLVPAMSAASTAITFTKFPQASVAPLLGDIAPEWYINHVCSVANPGETLNAYQFPVSYHVLTLQDIEATFTIQAMNNTGATGGILTIYLWQFLGSGVVSPAPMQIGQIVLNSGWMKSFVSFTFPGAAGDLLGTGGDDAFYIQIGMPLSATCNINFTVPSLYLSNSDTDVPTNSFATYDQIDTVINSPRTGDIRTSLNTFYPFGWVPMNDGTIGDAESMATARANIDTWPLYNLIWLAFANFSAGNSTTAGTNVIAPMFTAAAVPVGYGPNVTPATTAIVDFNAHKAIALTSMMGEVILGTVPVAKLINTYTTTFTATTNVLTAANNLAFFNGMPVYFVGTTTLSTTTVYYVTAFNGTTGFGLSTTFAQAITGVSNVTVATDSGTVISGLVGTQEGQYAHTQLVGELAQHTHNPLSPDTSFYGAGNTNNLSGGTNSLTSVATTGGITGFTATSAMNVTQPGVFMNIYMKL